MLMGCSDNTEQIKLFKESIYQSYVCSTYRLSAMMQAGTSYHKGYQYFHPSSASMVSYENVDFQTAVIRDYSSLPLEELSAIKHTNSNAVGDGDKTELYSDCVRCYSQSEAAYCVKQLFDLTNIDSLNNAYITQAKNALPDKCDNRQQLVELLVCATSINEISKYEDADYTKLLLITKALDENFNRLFSKCDSLFPKAVIDKPQIEQQTNNDISTCVKNHQQ